MLTPSLDELKRKIEEHHRYIPIALQLEGIEQQWFELFKHMHRTDAYSILLESGRAGRYSIMAFQPTAKLIGKNTQLTITTLHSDGREIHTEEQQGSLLRCVKEWMKQRQAPSIPQLPDFQGGLLGFFSYDIVREIEVLPNHSRDDLELPDLYLLAFEQVLVLDHKKQHCWLIMYQELEGGLEVAYNKGKAKLYQWAENVRKIVEQLPVHNGLLPLTWESKPTNAPPDIVPRDQDSYSLTKEKFTAAVKQVQEYIAAGDVFQVNLSLRQSKSLTAYPLVVYEQLRRINPSPYMGYLHYPEFQIISASPEQLIKLKEGEMNTRPIAGTRPRGENPQQDRQLAEELIHNEKERAEHVMLVDLERNDIGKVAAFGSVHVDEFMVIEEYSHVMHIVSNVKGKLDKGKDAFDVIRAVFPGGTITGAPKVRTMEIIEELEPTRRGIYTGSIGWIDYTGDMELNIVIRTILAKDGVAHVQAGAGIVIDSIPENEYQESLNKAKALWKALEQSSVYKRENEMSKLS